MVVVVGQVAADVLAADTTAAAINGRTRSTGIREGMRLQHPFGFSFDAISLHNTAFHGIVLLRSSLCAMSVAHLLATRSLGNHTFHILGDCGRS